jgi:hypothetical protein
MLVISTTIWKEVRGSVAVLFFLLGLGETTISVGHDSTAGYLW